MAIFKSREAKLAEEEVRLHAVLASLIPVYEKVIFQRLAIEKEVSNAEALTNKFGELVSVRILEHSAENGKKFQYLTGSTQDANFSYTYFDVLGQQGWELVSTNSYSVGGTNFVGQTNMYVHVQFFFKRELLNLPEEELAKLGGERQAALQRLPSLQTQLEKIKSYETEIIDRAKRLDPAAEQFLIAEIAKKTSGA
jgi:hypothetical protein